MAAKAERMRASILAAAEEQFARRGYAATRLDDVAEAMGMTAAALFYYFKDKSALYDAMMESAFATLATRLGASFSAEAPITERIERAVEAWIETVVARPALGRLVLRHIVDSEQHSTKSVYPSSEIFETLAWALFQEGKKTGELNPLHDHPYHSASAIIGSTIFYASALTSLVPGDFNPLSPEQVAAHKRDAVHMVRYFLGIKPPAARRSTPTPRKASTRARR